MSLLFLVFMPAIAAAPAEPGGYYTLAEAQSMFAAANEAYARDDFASAVADYERLLAHGQGGPDVLYNLGTAALAQGDIGKAILAFERARKAGARESDVEANLAVARSRQLDQVIGAASDEPFLARVVSSTSGQTVALGFLEAWLLGSALLLFRRWWPPRARGAVAVVGGLLFVVALPVGGLLAAHVAAERASAEAVVMRPVLRAHELPSEGAKVAFEVHAGLKVHVLEASGAYVHIRLPNGLEGWAERGGVEAL